MKRPRFSARERTSREAVELGKLATGLANSGSKLEDSFWEDRLADHIDRLLDSHAEDDLTQALDRLVEPDPRAHDELADMIESRAETMHLDGEGQAAGWDILLVAAPILATSRFGISAGTIPKATLTALTAQLSAHQLAKDARLALADYLFSPDQLPRTFSDTHAFMRELGAAAISGKPVPIDPQSMPETNKFLSDVRYIVGAVAVPAGGAVFRWNESDGTREAALLSWVRQGAPNIEPLLTGSTFQLLNLDAYHSACRTADRDARPYSVKASVAFLSVVTGHEPAQLRAVIGPFYDRRLEEFRVSFGPADSDEVYHGVVWPLLGAEDEAADIVPQIEEVLKECGVTRIDSLDARFPFEFCDECGVPLYPNAEGETVHAELPEQASQAPQVLH